MASITLRVAKGSALTLTEFDANLSNMNAELIEATAKTTIHSAYHFHGYAGQQIAGDGKFFDAAGNNHAIRGANLTDATCFANSGFVTTSNPATSTEDSVLRLPALNFDYAGGEKLILWWLGKITPEPGDVAFMGDGYGTTAGQRGWRIVVRGTDGAFPGKIQFNVFGATQGYAGTSGSVAFTAGALSSIALVLDGENQTVGQWVNEVYESSYGSIYWPFNTGTAYDTLSSNTVNIGTSYAAAAVSNLGIATQTRACVIMRLGPAESLPVPSVLTGVFQQLRTNPGKLILASSF